MSFPQRTLAAAFAVAAAALVVPSHAVAAPTYPPAGSNSITVSTTSPAVGDTVEVSAKTFQVGSDVDVEVEVVDPAPSGTTSLRAPGESTGAGRLGASLPFTAVGTCTTGLACTVVADADGVATAAVTLTVAGTTNITFAGLGLDGEPLTQTVEITTAAAAGADPAAPSPTDGLATTGPRDVMQTLAIGFAMLALGTGLVLVVRRRRDAFTVA